jgi:hypothetical protein
MDHLKDINSILHTFIKNILLIVIMHSIPIFLNIFERVKGTYRKGWLVYVSLWIIMSCWVYIYTVPSYTIITWINFGP